MKLGRCVGVSARGKRCRHAVWPDDVEVPEGGRLCEYHAHQRGRPTYRGGYVPQPDVAAAIRAARARLDPGPLL